jgi:hypothetical protein
MAMENNLSRKRVCGRFWKKLEQETQFTEFFPKEFYQQG